MPKFLMPVGTNLAAQRFIRLDAFTRGYIEAMFFTSTGSADDRELQYVTFADLAPETIRIILSHCEAFQDDNERLLDQACAFPDYNSLQAGRDFWFTRNRHGVGFWTSKLGQISVALDAAATKCGQVDLYVGDDDKLYL